MAAFTTSPLVVSAQTSEIASTATISADAQALRAAETRDAALERLCNLPNESLPSVRARITELRSTRPTGDAGYAALGELGSAAGAASPSDPRDLLPGLIAFPDDRFSRTHVVVAERYCLLRSLDRMGTAEALVAALPLVTFEIRAFRWQARHLVRRAGRRSTAMVIRAASIPNAEVDLWAGWALQSLGIRDSGDSVQEQTEESLIEVLRAYASVRHMGGMPILSSFVDDPRPTVRAAAREALALYAENTIWELRRLFQTRLGQDPGNRSWQLLMRDLYRGLDERREAPLRERAARSVAALNEGKLEEAASIADELLITAPVSAAARGLSPVFLARARAAAREGSVDEARSMVERALRLSGSNPDPEALTLRDQIRQAEWMRRGIVEERDDRPVVAADHVQASIADRRSVARYGFLAAFLLLAIQTLVSVGRRVGTESLRFSRATSRELLHRYRNGGRERLGRLLSRLRRSAVVLARRGFETSVALVGRTDRLARSHPVVPEPESTAPSSEALPEPALAAPLEAPVELASMAPREPLRMQPSVAPARVRKERPTRRAVASPELFTAARPKTARQRLP